MLVRLATNRAARGIQHGPSGGERTASKRPKGGERSLREISRELAADISMSAGGRSRLTASAICWAMS